MSSYNQNRWAQGLEVAAISVGLVLLTVLILWVTGVFRAQSPEQLQKRVEAEAARISICRVAQDFGSTLARHRDKGLTLGLARALILQDLEQEEANPDHRPTIRIVDLVVFTVYMNDNLTPRSVGELVQKRCLEDKRMDLDESVKLRIADSLRTILS